MGRGRKLRPKWQIVIDAYLFRFASDPTTIRLQEGRLRELRLTGCRTTPVYSLAGGTGGGESVTKEERYVQEIEQAEEQIRISQDRMILVNKLLCDYFSAEEQEFIRLFWLDVKPVDRGLVWIRTRAVIAEVGWLRDPEDRRRPSDSFWLWKKRIYNKWWGLLFPDMPKEETGTDYIEHKSLD